MRHDIGWAVGQLRTGAQVVRKSWDVGTWMELDGEDIAFWEDWVYVENGGLGPEDLLADDWGCKSDEEGYTWAWDFSGTATAKLPEMTFVDPPRTAVEWETTWAKRFGTLCFSDDVLSIYRWNGATYVVPVREGLLNAEPS